MKTGKIFFKNFLFYSIFSAILLQVSYAQDSTRQAAIQNSVNNKSFIFVAQNMSPMRGGFRPLTSYYDLKVSGDSVISNLPYVGRAYSAPIDPSEAGINFTSTNFEYTVNARKKGKGWDIVIKPKDVHQVQQLQLTVFQNGSASLQVTSNNRQPISFTGNIKETKEKM